jgi:hypothetical protein
MKVKHIEAPCCTLYGSGSSGKGHEGKRYLLLWLSTGIPLPVGSVWVCHVSRTMRGVSVVQYAVAHGCEADVKV